MVTICTSGFNIQNVCVLLTERVLYDSQNTHRITSLKRINWLVLLIEMQRVSYEIETEILNIMQITPSSKGLMCNYNSFDDILNSNWRPEGVKRRIKNIRA